jgi:Na+-translocating ferredoxin:NAD+ oxidoreductase RnfC subunit
MVLAEKVKNAGVVGAGGGGFPTHVKLAAKAAVVIANGAECEPLLHKDAAVMERQARAVVAGVRLTMEAVSAAEGVVALKAKNREALGAVEAACKNTPVRVHILGDYYPAGDEYDLVYSVTGRLIPNGGIPIQVGVVVNNVETLANVAAAAEGQPVIQKTLTIAGAVKHPVTLTVPIGVTYRELIQAAGGFATEDPVLCLGGLMMGETTDNLDRPVVKTATGVVVLPRAHAVVQRKLKPAQAQARIGKSACDQCRYCTEYCPRYLLGYAVEPHQVMRSLGFMGSGKDYWNELAAFCCACGLCTLHACPEGLFPKEACDSAKAEMRRQNLKPAGPAQFKPHPMREGRRVPIQTLMNKLGVKVYDAPAHWEAITVSPEKVVLPLKQSAGAPCQALVKAPDRVTAGQPIGQVPAGALGAVLHAPITGQVTLVTEDRIEISKAS